MPRARFRIMRPFTVSFSGGRTSAYMLRRILDAYGGKLPPDCFVLFANTGKERDETLEFIHEIETRWDVPVRWLEYAGDNRDKTRNWKEVTYETAHRTGNPGSPFDLLLGETKTLPNVVARFCTVQLKMKTMRRFLEDQGWDRDFQRRTCIGIRADESDRGMQIQADCPSYVIPVFPLIEAKITKPDVLKFWKKQPFDLQLEDHEGNCDGCFLKSRAKLTRIARDRPDLIEWWARWEKAKVETTTTGSKFRTDRTYAGILDAARQTLLFDENAEEDDSIPCNCGAGVGDWCDTEEDSNEAA